MIILGTPSVTLDFGIPDWALITVIGLMAVSYYLGRLHGIYMEKERMKEEQEVIEVNQRIHTSD